MGFYPVSFPTLEFKFEFRNKLLEVESILVIFLLEMKFD